MIARIIRHSFLLSNSFSSYDCVTGFFDSCIHQGVIPPLTIYFLTLGLFTLSYVSGCFGCMHVSHHVSACCHQRQEEGLGCPGIVVTDVCAPSRGCEELNPDCLQEQILLTTEPSLQRRDLLLSLFLFCFMFDF